MSAPPDFFPIAVEAPGFSPAKSEAIRKWLRPRLAGAKQFAEKPEQQIPHRLKPVRDDKFVRLATAQLKLRPLKTALAEFPSDL